MFEEIGRPGEENVEAAQEPGFSAVVNAGPQGSLEVCLDDLPVAGCPDIVDLRADPVAWSGADHAIHEVRGGGSDFDPDLLVAKDLIGAGVPLFVAKRDLDPDRQWRPRGGHHGTGYWFPRQWQKTEPDLAVLDRYEPGDALAMVCGHLFDVLDTDPRNGGDESRAALECDGAMPRTYGKAATPSGGTHELLAALGLRTRDNVRPGLDVKAGAADGSGRGFVFIAPTKKMSKVDNAIGQYRWDEPPDLDALAAQMGRDCTGRALANLISAARSPGRRVAAIDSTDHGVGGGAASTICDLEWRCSAEVLAQQERCVSQSRVGARNPTLYGAALKCGSSIAECGPDEVEVVERLTEAAAGCGLMEDDGAPQVLETIRSGLRVGQQNARKGLAGTGSADDADRRGDAGAQRLEDAHIGQRIADDYLQGRFLYSAGLGWMQYDGQRWHAVSEIIVREAVRRGVKAFVAAEVQAGADADRARKAAALLSYARIRAILAISQGYLAVHDERFDAHPDLLNVANGVVDLRDGSLRPHDPDLMFTKVSPTDYRLGAEHPDWQQALGAVQPDSVAWMQMRLGQGLTGYATPDDTLVVLKGSGENGKSTLIDAVRDSVGVDYAVPLPDRVLLARPGDHPTELMTLRGARLAFMEELPEIAHLDVKRLKMTHGTAQLTARYCGKDSVSWTATHTMFATTNYLPRVDESDHGTWRRLALAEFPFRYRKPHQELMGEMDRHGDPHLRERLRQSPGGQHEAVLAWLVHGAVSWYQNGRILVPPPASVNEATAQWRMASDVLLRFIDEVLVFDPQRHVMATELFRIFRDWMTNHGHTVWTDQNFSARFVQHSVVAEAGVEKKNGIRLSRGGLSRSFTTSLGSIETPKQFAAWMGVGFKDPALE